MSWSLKLQNGDLAFSGARYATVTGTAKLVQDLRCHLLQTMGEDSLHPEFGTVFDGGTTPDGRSVKSMMGNPDRRYVALAVESEIRRVLDEHQKKQLARAQSDRFSYNKTTLTSGEILYTIGEIDLRMIGDTLFARVNISVGNNQNISFDAPIGE